MRRIVIIYQKYLIPRGKINISISSFAIHVSQYWNEKEDGDRAPRALRCNSRGRKVECRVKVTSFVVPFSLSMYVHTQPVIDVSRQKKCAGPHRAIRSCMFLQRRISAVRKGQRSASAPLSRMPDLFGSSSSPPRDDVIIHATNISRCDR